MGTKKLAPGLYDELVTTGLARSLSELEPGAARVHALDEHALAALLPTAVARMIARAFARATDSEKLALAKNILAALDAPLEEEVSLDAPARRLEQVVPSVDAAPARPPSLSVNQSALITNDGHHGALHEFIVSELPTASRVDLVCAFIKWHGLRLLLDAITAAVERGVPVRVLTTTYMGVTEPHALEILEDRGAKVRVCYETQATRLHAKSWLIEREHGATTAYVGSSNLSHSALTDGMEWNVRLNERATPEVIARLRRVFDAYWSSDLFEPFDAERFRQEVARMKAVTDGSNQDAVAVFTPFPHQREVLEALEVERERRDRHANLIVAATGTGKTVIAAFDTKRLLEDVPGSRVLFVAHREDILRQARRTFAAVLGEPGYGELFVGGQKPERWEHVFASIQSLTAMGLESLDPTHFDFVILDECHHAAASTYASLLEHITPRELLGLTATPERADGASILDWFGGSWAAEIRLWDAIEQQLLVPFHYYGVHDKTDLSEVKWGAGGYDSEELTNLYTASDTRVALIWKQIEEVVGEPSKMKALGFCVSIEHANFMARALAEYGLETLALTSESSKETRRAAPEMLASGQLQVIFTVDLYNEGVDIPCVDTLLMLRPTESATVFLQQLGRGLRHAPEKACLTVLDFIGHMHTEFRFAERLSALLTRDLDPKPRELADALRGDAELYLPAGCAFHLDEQSQEEILERLERSITGSIHAAKKRLRQYDQDTTLAEFIRSERLEVADLYQTKAWYWTKLRAMAGHADSAYQSAFIAEVGERLYRIAHIDDSARLTFLFDLLTMPDLPGEEALKAYDRRMITMLYNQLWGEREDPPSTYAGALSELMQDALVVEELRQLAAALEEEASALTKPLAEIDARFAEVPLCVHGTYSRAEVLAAFGVLSLGEASSHREGVFYDEATDTDVLFVTLDKSSDVYGDAVMYNDYPLDHEHFHWESQNNTGPDTPVGMRYIDSDRAGGVLLFVRERDKVSNRSLPYRLLGPARYVRHSGEKPMAIVWELEVSMTQRLFDVASRATA
jgi:superfamily II DNA or RNA helicase